MLVMAGVCSGRGVQGVTESWRPFLMDHKEGAAYREAPLPFIEKNKAAYTWTHSQDAGYFIANMNSCFPNLFCKELVNFSR